MTLGSRGDVQPYVGLGVALADLGHNVSVSTGQGFDELITKHGLTSASMRVDFRDLLNDPTIQGAMKSPKGLYRAFKSSQALMQQQLDDMWSVVQQVRPDLIVYHPKAFLAPYLAREVGAIAVPSFLQPAFVPTRAIENALLPLPNLGGFANRAVHGVMGALMNMGYRSLLKKWFARHEEVSSKALDVLAGFHPKGDPLPRLHAHSAALLPKPADWGVDDHVTGYWFFEELSAFTPSAELEAFLDAGPPPTYIGFGSMPSVDAERTRAVVAEALERAQVRAILATGWGALAGSLASDQVFVLESAPHDWLFARCQAVVHHGGAGTTHEGLRWGRPSLICPLFGDQPFWGRAVAQNGLGPKPLPLRKMKADELADALKALQSGQFETRASAMGDLVRVEHGATVAAGLVHALL